MCIYHTGIHNIYAQAAFLYLYHYSAPNKGGTFCSLCVYRRVGNFWGWKFSQIGHFKHFHVFIFEDSTGKWSQTHKQAMGLRMHTCMLNVFNGAKYFCKAILISISLSLQLSVEFCTHTAITWRPWGLRFGGFNFHRTKSICKNSEN